jgi:hypothetical protein
MAKSEQGMQRLMDNPDSLDMDDEEAILALANNADLPEEALDQDAADLDKADDKSADKSASDSADADDKDKEGLSDDDIKAPVQSKDGKHTIPYDVLDSTRRNLKSTTTELEDQRAENARLKAQLDQAKSGDLSDEDLEKVIDEESTASTPEEEFFAKNGMTPDDFTKEYGSALTKSLLGQAKDALETRQQLGVLMEDRNQKVQTEEDEVAITLQGAIDAIPSLAALQAEGGDRWKEAVETDNA